MTPVEEMAAALAGILDEQQLRDLLCAISDEIHKRKVGYYPVGHSLYDGPDARHPRIIIGAEP